MLLVGTARFHQAYSQTGGDDGIENTILFMVCGGGGGGEGGREG